MKNAFIISIILVLIIGCSTESRKQEEIRNLHIRDSLKLIYQQDSIRKVKLEIEQQLIQDSINKEEEKIAISDINFGINRSEYKIKEKLFLKSLFNKAYNHSQIGNFSFDLIPSFTANNSLYSLCLKGNKSTYSVERDYESLLSVLRAKYSEPDIHNGLPNWNEKDQDLVLKHQKSDYIETCGYSGHFVHYYDCDIWEIGNKRIEVRLYFNGKWDSYVSNDTYESVPKSYKYTWKHISLFIYQKNTLKRLENEKGAKFYKESTERQIKEKEDLEKAIKVL